MPTIAKFKISNFVLLITLLVLTSSCALSNNFPSIDETGDESASIIPPDKDDSNTSANDSSDRSNNSDNSGNFPGASNDSSFTGPSPAQVQRLLLNQAMSLRYEKNGILENRIELPAGTQIEIPTNYELKNIDYRNSNGGIDRSSTGFVYPVKLVSVTEQFRSQFPATKIAEINGTSGGLYISASIVGSIVGTEGSFAVIQSSNPGAGFLKYYNSNGKPKFTFTNSVAKRFGPKLNKGILPESMPSETRNRYLSIFNELRKAANRSVSTPKSYLMMDKAAATQWSIKFENSGAISTTGAWSIATQGTAVRHGFSNVPCAEFQSELLRQAYQRAGYRVTDDFNISKGNQLIWSNTAAVANYSMALYKAGWIPWDSTKYRPVTGAIMMNGSGLTPGHTYISAGDDGMIIVDNGAPQGRDLRKTSDKIISIMFKVGVFFLPPGINPPAW